MGQAAKLFERRPPESIREAIRTALENAGRDQTELAQRIGISKSTMSRRLQREPPEWQELYELCEALAEWVGSDALDVWNEFGVMLHEGRATRV